MTFDDEEAQKAIDDAIASDDTDQALAASKGMDFTNDPAVIDMDAEHINGSSPDPMDKVLNLADAPPPMQWKTLYEPTPTPQSDIAGPNSDLGIGSESEVTRNARANANTGGGFDFFRGLFAAGGGSLADYDAPKLRRDAQIEKNVSDIKADSLVRQAMDPGSQISKQRQGEYAAQMKMRAQMANQLGQKDLAKMFDQQAQTASTMSATQIDRASGAMGGIAKEYMSALDAKAKQDLASQNLDLKRRSTLAQEAMANANFGLRRDEIDYRRQEQEKAKAEASEKENEKEQEAYGKDVGPLNETKALLDQAKEQKKKVDTGKLSNFWQTRVMAPLGLKDKDFTSLEATQGTINNAITKLQSGGNVTDNEAFRLRQQLADLSQDDPEFDIKLNQMMQTIALKIEQVKLAHPRAARTRDQKLSSATSKDQNKGNKPPPAPAGTPSGAKRTNKSTGAVWTWNGSDWN